MLVGAKLLFFCYDTLMLHVLLGKEGMFYLRYLIDFLFTEF